MRDECIQCQIKTINNLIEKFQPSKHVAKEFHQKAQDLLNNNKELDNLLLATEIHRLVKRKLNNLDPYLKEKKHANELLINSYDSWAKLVTDNKDPYHTALKLAVAGNIIDYGAHSVPADIESQIFTLLKQGFAIDKSKELFEKINAAKSILYLGDNAGEIIFDKLFIQTIQHPNITFAVRGEPILNDVTMKDAELTGINKICSVISNGNDAPSTVLDQCSDEFLEVYNTADLIISKGQGNFEGLMDSGISKIFFLLIAKCDIMADTLGVKKGDLIVTNLAR